MSEPYWEPLAAAPLPPVVNGQWVKGVGGAAVWSAIAAADIAGYPGDQLRALAGDGSWQAFTRQVAGSVPAGTLKLQVGTFTATLPAGDPVTFPSVNLPTPWTGGHSLFMVAAWPSAHWNFYVRSVGLPNGLAAGWPGQFYNGGAAQSMNCSWISLGW